MTTTMTRIKATGALAPLAILSLGWTSLLLVPAEQSTGAPSAHLGRPAVTTPALVEELPEPASSTWPLTARRGAARVQAAVARSTSTRDIPTTALLAYQRAAAVINATDANCALPWELLAAIGRVESDHGRHGASSLDNSGTARPPIIGMRLNGRNHTSAVRDTDAGRLDGDRAWDHAVGPMQFIPSTWSLVGVDADGDGRRDPQDIDDAALGAAVYLCAGNGDLSTRSGRRAALLRYNHSTAYVGVVLSYFTAYSAAGPVRASAMPTGLLVSSGPASVSGAPGPTEFALAARAPCPRRPGRHRAASDRRPVRSRLPAADRAALSRALGRTDRGADSRALPRADRSAHRPADR